MKRNKRFTATKTIVSSTPNADGFFDEAVTAESFQFWGSIKDLRADYRVANSKIYEEKLFAIEVDTRSVRELDFNYTLSYDNNTDAFRIVDTFESKFDRMTTIIAQYTN